MRSQTGLSNPQLFTIRTRVDRRQDTKRLGHNCKVSKHPALQLSNERSVNCGASDVPLTDRML